MQWHEMMTAMAELGLKGMAGAFDEAVTTGLQRKRMTMEILTDLLRAETAHRHAASVRYRMSAAKLPAVKDLDAFVFDGTPINEGLVRSLHSGSFLAGQRNIVLVGGTGTGKTHLASAITANVVRNGARGLYFNTVDLVNRLGEKPASARPVRSQLSCHASRSWCSTSLVICRSPAQAGSCSSLGQQVLRANLGHRHDEPCLWRMAHCLWRPEDDRRAARPHYVLLRHRRIRKRQLALRAPQLALGDPTEERFALVAPLEGLRPPYAATSANGASVITVTLLDEGGLFWTPIDRHEGLTAAVVRRKRSACALYPQPYSWLPASHGWRPASSVLRRRQPSEDRPRTRSHRTSIRSIQQYASQPQTNVSTNLSEK